MHASIVVEIMDSIVVMSLMIRIVLYRTQNKAKFEGEMNLSSGGDHNVGGHQCGGWHNQGQGNYKFNKLGVANTARHSGIKFLMEFEWIIVASVRPGVALPMHILLVFMMLLF